MLSPLWKAGSMSREEAYDRLCDYMGLEPADCHLSLFDLQQCKQVHQFITDLFCDVGFEDLSREERGMSLLSKVRPARRQRPPRILLGGTEKIGKSTFASGFAKPVFIPIEKEQGIDDVDADAFPVARTYDDVMECVRSLVDETHDYKTLAIDSGSTFAPLVLAKAMEVEGVKSEEKLGGGFGREANTQLLLWSALMEGLDQLRDKGMTTILICHTKTSRFEDPINGSYTKYEIDLPKKIGLAINRWCDSILFANWEVYRTTEDVGFSKEHHRGSGTGRRMLFTQARPAHPGGGRGIYGQLPYELPFTAEAFKDAVLARISERKAVEQTDAPELVEA